ncbi:MAG: hypoxanthine phosphoribosyltransferase [Clostridiales bacterium]|nr:hypoxanthine phosphoribosyltransferase [Clostridiales bacterium]
MINDIAKTLLSEETIQTRVKEMGAEIARDFKDKNPIMVCILKGAVMFYADLLRATPIPLSMDFMAVSSYGNKTKSSGEVEIKKDLSSTIEGRHIIIVEDIIDSGFTLSYLKRVLSARGAASISLCTLLDKPSRRAPGIDLKSNYSGFEVGDEFVVGYGLDYAEKYRNLPFIGVLKPEIYENN